jgi:hypothetical protein
MMYFAYDCTGLNIGNFPISALVFPPLQYYLKFTADSDFLYWIPGYMDGGAGVLREILMHK